MSAYCQSFFFFHLVITINSNIKKTTVLMIKPTKFLQVFGFLKFEVLLKNFLFFFSLFFSALNNT